MTAGLVIASCDQSKDLHAQTKRTLVAAQQLAESITIVFGPNVSLQAINTAKECAGVSEIWLLQDKILAENIAESWSFVLSSLIKNTSFKNKGKKFLEEICVYLKERKY